ncbi:MAG: tetratricopeptide repeat protein [Candidatus Scalindua sp.]|nr:tetratricopeptide repeat protein [Candidatus Scalindua sp.]MBT6230035.1 tetratricopeptide repeat protein [Candidatus Scalindua sp.]MBT7213181.1 tetratricopeptide repeat protein [Candidatus Scalindua sp.]MBT7590071.1 tetratricopeptide repeat protein [Candidatus Scalindua sp.]
MMVFCLFLGCSRKDDDHYNRLGINYLNNGQHNYAIDAFKKAVKLNPSSVEAHFNLGRAFKKKGMEVQAKSEFSISHRLNPNKFNEYVKKYKEKIGEDLTGTQNYSELGSAYAEKGMIDDAINAYKKSIEIEPDNARAHYSLGTLYSMKGKYDDAADEFWVAVEIDPDMSEAHYNLGLSYYRQGMFDKAITEYQATLKLLPETQKKKRAGVHYKLGMAYEGSKVFDDAIHELKKAIKLMPKDARIHHQLSVVYKKAGLFKKAEKETKIYEKLKKGKSHH